MLRNNAANIHETSDWDVVFAVLEIVGAAASPDDQDWKSHEDETRSALPEAESQAASSRPGTPRERSNSIGSNSGGWIVLGNNPNAPPAAEEKMATASKVSR